MSQRQLTFVMPLVTDRPDLRLPLRVEPGPTRLLATLAQRGLRAESLVPAAALVLTLNELAAERRELEQKA